MTPVAGTPSYTLLTTAKKRKDIDLGDDIELEDDDQFNDGADIGGRVDDGVNEGNFDEAINQEHVWIVITKFFDERGLVKQQIESFDEFINTTLQTAVNENHEANYFPTEAVLAWSRRRVDGRG